MSKRVEPLLTLRVCKIAIGKILQVERELVQVFGHQLQAKRKKLTAQKVVEFEYLEWCGIDAGDDGGGALLSCVVLLMGIGMKLEMERLLVS